MTKAQPKLTPEAQAIIAQIQRIRSEKLERGLALVKQFLRELQTISNQTGILERNCQIAFKKGDLTAFQSNYRDFFDRAQRDVNRIIETYENVHESLLPYFKELTDLCYRAYALMSEMPDVPRELRENCERVGVIADDLMAQRRYINDVIAIFQSQESTLNQLRQRMQAWKTGAALEAERERLEKVLQELESEGIPIRRITEQDIP